MILREVRFLIVHQKNIYTVAFSEKGKTDKGRQYYMTIHLGHTLIKNDIHTGRPNITAAKNWLSDKNNEYGKRVSAPPATR